METTAPFFDLGIQQFFRQPLCYALLWHDCSICSKTHQKQQSHLMPWMYSSTTIQINAILCCAAVAAKFEPTVPSTSVLCVDDATATTSAVAGTNPLETTASFGALDVQQYYHYPLCYALQCSHRNNAHWKQWRRLLPSIYNPTAVDLCAMLCCAVPTLQHSCNQSKVRPDHQHCLMPWIYSSTTINLCVILCCAVPPPGPSLQQSSLRSTAPSVTLYTVLQYSVKSISEAWRGL